MIMSEMQRHVGYKLPVTFGYQTISIYTSYTHTWYPSYILLYLCYGIDYNIHMHGSHLKTSWLIHWCNVKNVLK